jgi:hypothetical protein
MLGRKAVHSGFLSLVAIAYASAGNAETLTLDQAVTMALENNRGLRSSALEVHKA